MKASLFRHANQNGLTLLEIIVTLTIASVLGTVIVLYMNTSLIQSAESISSVQNTYALNLVIEQMTADYVELLDTGSDPLVTLQGRITAGDYGQYNIAQNNFITFSGGNEDSDPGDNRILKVTVTSTSNDQLTTTVLFTK